MSTSTETTLLERLTFFSDAVFAIAITLLVIEVTPPTIHHATEIQLAQALVDLLPKYIGFIVSFFVIGRFWLGHHRLFGLLRRADDRLIIANLILLFGIAFMPFTSAVFSEYASLKTATWLYTGWLILIGLFNRRLVVIALRPELLANGYDASLAQHIKRGTWLPIGLGIAASLAAFAGSLFTLLVLLIGPGLASLLLSRFRHQVAPSD